MILQEYEKRHAARIRETAAECTVLLKKDGRFPLDNPCRLLLTGAGARQTVKGGTGSGEVNSHFYTTIEEGLKNAGFSLCGGEWLDAYDALMAQQAEKKRERLRRVLAEEGLSGLFLEKDHEEPVPFYDFPLPTDADAAVYILSRNSGEGSDRSDAPGDFRLMDCEIRDIRSLAANYEKFMLVLNVGGVVDLSPILAEVPNVLLLSQLGVATGDVLADILLGKADPSGRLTATWAPIDCYPSADNFGARDDTRYREGIFVGYRYFETMGVKPIFPFGFGLSYTEFARSCTDFSLDGACVTLTVSVKNTGKRSGKDVAQLFVSKPVGKLPQPRLHLAAFDKTKELKPGETEVFRLCVDLRELASYDERTSRYVLEAGDYVFLLGTSVEDVNPCGVVEVPERIAVRQLKPVGGRADFDDPELCAKPLELPQDLPRLCLSPEAIQTETVCYDLPSETDPLLEMFPDRDLALLCLGYYLPGAEPSMVGNSGRSVCGAAGETTMLLKDRGIDQSLVLADGPAGLRLTPVYAEDENGLYSCDENDIQKMRDFLTPELAEQFGLGPELDEKIRKAGKHTQYCTAIPIGTAIAQSFNLRLAEQYGDLVGDEMERFGIHLWLTPGMNLHRHPLCGRNFEYYSEDPLVSGLMAAAITRGVQKHPGCGTTIKHFCCNNQEFRRTKNNAVVSERALRELYLRGFEIAIRESNPKAVMSSYNLVNGVHTSERYDLITDFLRCECGFDGLVMTDWIGTDYAHGDGKYRNACAAPTMKAGNDLFMPGCDADLNDILHALENGELTREELLRNATRVYHMIYDLNNERNRR